MSRRGVGEWDRFQQYRRRNRTLDAADRYARYNPPEPRHQAGASLGGPIVYARLPSASVISSPAKT